MSREKPKRRCKLVGSGAGSLSMGLLLAIVVVIGLALVACGGTTETTATTTATTVAPTATTAGEVTTTAPSGATTTAPAAKSDTMVALISGGPEQYFDPWGPSSAQAVVDFNLAGADFRVPQDWVLDYQNQMIDAMVSQGFNAFAIFPADFNATNAKIDQLVAKGIPVIALAGPVKEPSKAEFCIATMCGESAYEGTKHLIEAMGGKGAILHGAGMLVDPNTQLRCDGVDKAVAETNGAVTVVQTIADIMKPEDAVKAMSSYLAANGDKVDGIITTANGTSIGTIQALKSMNNTRIKSVHIDTDKGTLQAIRDGLIEGTMIQNPWGQGYIGTYVLDLLMQGYKRKVDAPWFINSGQLYVTKANIDSYEQDTKKVTDDIVATFKDKYLTK